MHRQFKHLDNPHQPLVEDMPTAFRQRFAITHYFNPQSAICVSLSWFGAPIPARMSWIFADYNDRVLGKGVVRCADTPGFLGNRVGVFALRVGIDEAFRCGLTIEEADAHGAAHGHSENRRVRPV